ncbi:DUF305 domain-containing protein [Helicobacter sp.]|uniref:DUF305 domain-containing protein n=1 Tax=Helicobacter sp. TaxID=218 RepID=UPI0025BDD491|nr:DUF305 domain-containing protein [Helicobacter sp.]MCI5968891.1 DUF305 domain-containing protein [Helicobacter sp.]MDY2584383.1 DUF305 domain-containing protein [Helicobacter sp.]
MKKIILSCFVASVFVQMSMANSHASHSHHMHNMASDTTIQEVVDLMHAPMMNTQFIESGNPNIDFLKNMIPHHEGAILSSKKLIQNKALDPKLKKIAEGIILEQEKEIKHFKELLRNAKQFDQTITKEQYQQFVLQEKQDMDLMMQKMSELGRNETLETAYMKSMIAHHNGAINAARQILSITNNPTITKIANQIIAAQETEVKQFEEMLLHASH